MSRWKSSSILARYEKLCETSRNFVKMVVFIHYILRRYYVRVELRFSQLRVYSPAGRVRPSRLSLLDTHQPSVRRDGPRFANSHSRPQPSPSTHQLRGGLRGGAYIYIGKEGRMDAFPERRLQDLQKEAAERSRCRLGTALARSVQNERWVPRTRTRVSHKVTGSPSQRAAKSQSFKVG